MLQDVGEERQVEARHHSRGIGTRGREQARHVSEEIQQHQSEPERGERGEEGAAHAARGIDGGATLPCHECADDRSDGEGKNGHDSDQRQRPGQRRADEVGHVLGEITVGDTEVEVDDVVKVLDVLAEEVALEHAQLGLDCRAHFRSDRTVLSQFSDCRVGGRSRHQSRQNEVHGDCRPESEQEQSYLPKKITHDASFL